MSHLLAITTCPRPGGARYLPQTLASLGAAAQDAVVFDDVHHLGARWNTWRALAAGGYHERLLLFQDDVIAEPGLVERMLEFPIPDDVGVVNFHDCGDDFFWEMVPPGVYRFPAHRPGGLGMVGAQCLLIPGAHAAWLASCDLSDCPQPGPHNADFAISWFTARSPRPSKLIVSPAPVRHIGERSACHDEARRAAGASIPHAGRTLLDILRRTP